MKFHAKWPVIMGAFLAGVTSVTSTVGMAGMADMPASSAAPGIHAYMLDSYPVRADECAAVAGTLADKLKSVAGVTIYGTRCLNEGDGVADVIINYVAEAPLTITSTQGGIRHDVANAMYGSMDECLAGLGAEVAAFEENLGLRNFAAWCFRKYDSSHYPFAARVDAIGVAKDGMRVIDDMELMFSPVLGATDILGDVMTERLRERGVKVVRSVVGMEDGVSEYWAGARYYAKESLFIKLKEVNNYKAVETCEEDVETLQRILENGRVPPLSVFCTSDSLLGLARLYMMSIPGDYDQETAPDTFANREACLNGKAAVEEAYRTALGREVIGSLCVISRFSTSEYGVKVFSNP